MRPLSMSACSKAICRLPRLRATPASPPGGALAPTRIPRVGHVRSLWVGVLGRQILRELGNIDIAARHDHAHALAPQVQRTLHRG